MRFCRKWQRSKRPKLPPRIQSRKNFSRWLTVFTGTWIPLTYSQPIVTYTLAGKIELLSWQIPRLPSQRSTRSALGVVFATQGSLSPISLFWAVHESGWAWCLRCGGGSCGYGNRRQGWYSFSNSITWFTHFFRLACNQKDYERFQWFARCEAYCSWDPADAFLAGAHLLLVFLMH